MLKSTPEMEREAERMEREAKRILPWGGNTIPHRWTSS
jgi:hypothetical protein